MEAIINITGVIVIIFLLILYVRGSIKNTGLKQDRDLYQQLYESKEKDLISSREALSQATRSIQFPLGKYIIREDKGMMAFTVGRNYLHSTDHETFVAIKNFYYFDQEWPRADTYFEEDREQARRDAEELIDKLNEK